MLLEAVSAAVRVTTPGPLELVLILTVYAWVAPLPSVLPEAGV